MLNQMIAARVLGGLRDAGDVADALVDVNRRLGRGILGQEGGDQVLGVRVVGFKRRLEDGISQKYIGVAMALFALYFSRALAVALIGMSLSSSLPRRASGHTSGNRACLVLDAVHVFAVDL
jgi:hypothetical protein